MSISKKEWFWVLLVCVGLLALSSLPYMVGYASQDEQLVFSGVVADRPDYAVHLAAMHLGERGEWHYRLRFTTEPHPGKPVKQAYIALGHLARLCGLSLPVTFQIARLAFGLTALLAIYGLVALIFTARELRLLAFGLAAFGSGLGWLQWMVGWENSTVFSPIDFWFFDPYVFFGMMVFPHFSLVTTLNALVAALFLSQMAAFRWWKWLAISILTVMMQWIQPFAPLMIDISMTAVVLVRCVIDKRLWLRDLAGLGWVAVAQIPLLWINYQAFFSHPVWQGFSAQNITLTPPPIYLLFGFGVFWILAIPAILSLPTRLADEKEESPRMYGLWLSIAWCLAGLFLAYFPLLIQRRFLHAFTIPLAILAAFGFDIFFKWLGSFLVNIQRIRRLSSMSLVLLASISSLFLVLGLGLLISQRPPDFYDPVELVTALDWLANTAESEDVVLAEEETSQLAAVKGGFLLFSGHPMETVDYPEKRAVVESFYTGELGLHELRARGIRWVIYGPYEHSSLSAGVELPGFEQAYQNEVVTIYRVKP